MKSFKKALSIGFGMMFILLGIGATILLLLNTSVPLLEKSYFIVVSIAIAGFGWWLLRRGSESVWDAISWFFAFLAP